MPRLLPISDLWLAPHRPLFLAAALWSVAALAWWQWGALAGLASPTLGTTTLWHAHEMLLGFGGASMAAYFLTAVSSWTGRPAITGRTLQAVVALWLLARLAMAFADHLPTPVLLAPGLGYFGLVAGLLAREIVATRAWGKLGFPAAVAALGVGDALFLLSTRGLEGLDTATLTRGLVMFFVIKVSIIGGKMLPAFTGNWLRSIGSDAAPRENLMADRLGLALLFTALALTLAGAEAPSALALIAAGAAQLWRLAGWQSRAGLRNPLLAMLHLTFLWLPVGLVLTGLARLLPDLMREADALHALTMGAMGGMILSIAARAAARRTEGALQAGPLLIAAYALIWAATVLRLATLPAASLAPALVPDLTDGAALAWVTGWGLFVLAFLPTLRGAVQRPVFSGPRA
ncbi:NnrS family protein [Paracoccaceae bacterium Fryx2]|nr:NnrS family protein [Paracoccaceae bacterium Fryx2]